MIPAPCLSPKFSSLAGAGIVSGGTIVRSTLSLAFMAASTPKLIATARTRGPALAISKGIDRDRAVDESGNQLAVFGRRGARPLNGAEAQALYLRNGQLYTVADSAPELARGSASSQSAAVGWLERLRSWAWPSADKQVSVKP